jgi:hypothetical protein
MVKFCHCTRIITHRPLACITVTFRNYPPVASFFFIFCVRKRLHTKKICKYKQTAGYFLGYNQGYETKNVVICFKKWKIFR